MSHHSAQHEPSLIDVQLAFEHWRSQRSARQPTPDHLRSLAVALLEHHVPFTVCKALGVNGSALKQWALELAKQDSGHFVTLAQESTPPAQPIEAPNPAVTIRLPNGVQVSVTHGIALSQVLSAACSLGASA